MHTCCFNVFKLFKLQVWNFTPNTHVNLVQRDELIDPVRVPSVFKDGNQKIKDDSDDDPDLDVLIKPRPVSNYVLFIFIALIFY